MGSWNGAAEKNLRDSWKAALTRVVGWGGQRLQMRQQQNVRGRKKAQISSPSRSRKSGEAYDLRAS